MSIQLVSTLLPQGLVDRLLTQDSDENLGEKAMCATSLLILNTVLGTVKVLENRDYKLLDANAGDGGCQNQALELRRLVMLNLQPECNALEKQASEIKKIVNNRMGTVKTKIKCSPQDFFKNYLQILKLSKEMEYLVHCFLSKSLRVAFRTHPNGVVQTKSEISRLSMLSKQITAVEIFFRSKIVENNQKILSSLSVAAVHFSATQIVSIETKEKALMVTMLSPENTRIITKDNYEPKTFGCLFYEVKTLLIRLKEEQGLICLKSIVPKGKTPFYLFLQSQESAKEFEVLPKEKSLSLPLTTLITVFEVVFHVEKEEASKHLMEYGFTNTMLVQAAKEAPYDRNSTIDDVKVPEAAREIMVYRKKDAENFLTLDHVYLNSLGKEKVNHED